MKNQFIKSVKESLKHWYLFLIVGILLISTGIWTITSPVESYMALSTIFSLTFLISGIIEIVFAFLNKERIDNWGWTLVFGFLNALIGIMLLTNPLISATTLPIYVGFLIMFRSFGAIGTALDLKNYGNLEWGSLMLIGVISLFFSFFLIWNPLFTGISIIIWTGLALISSGIFNIYLSIKIRNIHKKIQKLSIE